MNYLLRQKTLLDLIEEALRIKKFVGTRETENWLYNTRLGLKKGSLYQTIIKGISHRNKTALKAVLNYFDKEKEVKYDYLEGLESSNNIIFDIHGGKATIEQIKNTRVPKWIEYQENAKKGEVLQHHFIFSTKEKPNQRNAKKLEGIMKIMQSAFNLNHQESIFTIHTDKEFLHAHIVVNKFNINKEKRYIKKPFLMAVKELYKEELNNSFGKKYTILKKKFTFKETPTENLKLLKKINETYGQEGIEYYSFLSYKVGTKKSTKYNDIKATMQNSLQLATSIQTREIRQMHIKEVKEEITKFLKYREKGRLKKSLQKIFNADDPNHLSSVIDFAVARKNKLLTQEKYFGNKNYSEIQFLEKFLIEVRKNKKSKELIKSFNELSEKIKQIKKWKEEETESKANSSMKIIESFLIEKKYFNYSSKSSEFLKKKIFKFYQKNKIAQFIMQINLPKEKKENILLNYLAQKIINPIKAREVLKELETKYFSKITIGKKISF